MISILSLIEERQLARLRDDASFIATVMSELVASIARLDLPETSYRGQELRSEYSTWAAHHRSLMTKIRELTEGSPDHSRAMQNAARTEQLRQRVVERHRKTAFEMAQAAEEAGDWREASIARLSALEGRKIAEHEIH